MNHALTISDQPQEIVATLTSKGQVTVPVQVRKQLGLKRGDKLAFVLKDKGGIELRVPHYPDLASLQGSAGKLLRPMSWDEIEQTVADDRAEAYRAKFGGPDHD